MVAVAQKERQEQARSIPVRPPYASYAAIASTFVGGLGLASFVGARLRRRELDRAPFELAMLGLATFKASRTLAHDEVTSFIRRPFVEGGRADPEDEQPVPDGSTKQAIGELVTCSRCVGTWVAGGITALDVLAPRFGRTLTWALALGGANDWLQAGFAWVTAAANEAE